MLNAGVSSYGLDQVVLRAEKLLERYEPDVVVLGYVDDDIHRCQLSFYTAWKPCFDVEGGELAKGVRDEATTWLEAHPL